MRFRPATLLLVVLSGRILAQPVPDVEQRLADTTGEERLELLVELTEAYRREDPTRAIAYGTEALELLALIRDRERELEVLNSLVFAHGRLKEYEQGLLFGARAERLARAMNHQAALAFALRNIAAIHRRLNRHQRSIDISLESSRIYEELGDKAGHASTLNSTGTAYLTMDDYPRALELFLRAHRLFKELGDRRLVGLTLNNLGIVYKNLEEHDKALEFYSRALELSEQAADERSTAKTLNNIGNIFNDQGKPARALEYFRRSLELKEKLEDRQGVAHALNNIGLAHRNLGNFERALEFFDRSLEIKEELGDKAGLAGTYRYLAEAHQARSDHGSAIEALEKSLAMAAQAHARNDLQISSHALSESYAEMGRFEDALEAFRRYEEVKSEIFNERNSEIVAEMQARFEAEQKEQEIELLKKKQALDALEGKRQQTLRRALAGAAALMLVVVLLLHNRHRQRTVNRKLVKLDKLKDEFLANTSHEVRTPLFGMTGLAESLVDGARGKLPDSVRSDLAMIVSSGRRLGVLVDDILDFSKLRHRSLALDRRPVDLRAVVEVVLTLSRPLVGSKRLELDNAVPPDLPAADADENRLVQILHNLVGNAIKFTESGSVEVSAEVSRDPAEGERLVARVSDTGIGIPQAEQVRVFDAFEQADASAERQHGGTGLGLTVTRQLVELHGGRIWVESQPGEGSRFCFSLPVSSREPEEPAVAAPIVRATAIEPAGEPSAAEVAGPAGDLAARVLIVDDEPVNLQVLRNYLATRNLDVTMASSGEEAVRLLLARPFDLVLLDIMMPKMSGYEVCRVLRQRRPLAQLPVIFLTAKTQAQDVMTGLALGANDYLTKPISRGELIARIRPHLDLLQVCRHLEELVEEKTSQIKVLRGILPICASCKKVRDDEGYWSELEVFVDRHSEAELSHGICPDCMEEYRARRGDAQSSP